MYEYLATKTRVIDADTLRLQVDLGFSICTDVTVRLARIDAPEMNTPRGIIAYTYVSNLIRSCAALKVKTTKREKYGRWVGEVWLLQRATDAEWFNLNDDLVRHSHAKYKDYG